MSGRWVGWAHGCPRTTTRRVARAGAIPQLSWRDPQPAPIVLISGPEEVCAERATSVLRDYLRAEDPSLEVSDLRADDYVGGTLLGLTSPSLFGEPRLVRVSGVEKCSDAFLAEALSYLAVPQEGATVMLRHTGATVRGKKLLDAIRAGEGGGVEIACPAIKRDGDRFDFAAGEFRAAKKRIAPAALRALVSAFADDLTELAGACQQLIADVPGDITEQIVERYYGGRVETSAFTVADTAIAGRYGEALIVAPACARLRAPTRCRSSRRSRRSCARWRASPAVASPRARWPRGSGSRTGRSTAPAATSPAGPSRRSAWRSRPRRERTPRSRAPRAIRCSRSSASSPSSPRARRSAS